MVWRESSASAITPIRAVKDAALPPWWQQSLSKTDAFII